jgi:hypothetical protein
MVILLSTGAFYAERGIMCNEKNNFCAGTAEPQLGLAGLDPVPGWYALRGSYDGATYQGGNGVGFLRRKSDFVSIPMAAYWCVQTITTTGYGEINTETFLGKLVGVATMLMGLVMLALPITIISENFALEYQSKELRLLEEQEKSERAALGAKTKKKKTVSACLLCVASSLPDVLECEGTCTKASTCAAFNQRNMHTRAVRASTV